MFYLFFNKYDPRLYQLSGSLGNNPGGKIDNLVFTPMVCPFNAALNEHGENTAQESILYVDDGTCVIPKHNVRIVQKIRWRDNSIAFTLLQYIP